MTANVEDRPLDTDLTWETFIGQERAKRQLQRAAGSALIRGVRMPHTLLASGIPGIGKTTLAALVAQTMGTKIRVISGKTKVGEARMILSEMEDRDVLLVDEIHTLFPTKKDGEWLLHLMENQLLVGPRGPEQQPDVTIIGTTTDVGRLPDAVLERFPLSARPALEPYSDEEAARIAGLMCGRAFPAPLPLPPAENLREIACAANNNPRLIRGLVEALRDATFFHRGENWQSGKYDLSEVLADAGLTPDGLTELAVRYLVVMLDEWRGEPAGAAALKERLRETAGLGYTERLLMDKGYLAFTKRGRDLTQEGMRRARELRGG